LTVVYGMLRFWLPMTICSIGEMRELGENLSSLDLGHGIC
jgi:hypothetical protein